MMMKPCPACSGRGVVPREVRKMADGSADPLDFRREELCPPCAGSGKVPDVPADAVKSEPRKPGFVADHIAVTSDWIGSKAALAVPLADETESDACG